MTDWNTLSTAELIKLSETVTSAYGGEDEVWRDVALGTGEDIFRKYIPQDALPMQGVVEKVLTGLHRDGTLPYFLMQLVKAKPGRTDLPPVFSTYYPQVDFIKKGIKAGYHDVLPEVPFDVQLQGETKTRSNSTYAPGFEKTVRPGNPHLNPYVWNFKLSKVFGVTCRIELGDFGIGTGFLIGPQVILTNYHVIARYINNEKKLENIRCRFDYFIRPDGQINLGTPVSLGGQKVILSKPYDAMEATKKAIDARPDKNHLDYALLHLERPVGMDSNNGTPRGWIDISKPIPDMQKDMGIIIVQHPKYKHSENSEPLKLAIDTQAFIPHDVETRCRYHTNTEPGSSGSPCFNMSLDIFALHHLGDPGWRGDDQVDPEFNQGVPIDLIYNDIVNEDQGSWLSSPEID